MAAVGAHDRRGRWVPALALAVAAALPAAVVRAPLLSVAALGAAVGAAFLLLRLDAAVLVFVGLAPFEDYASAVSGASVKLAGLLLFAAWGLRLLTDRTRERLRHPGVRAAVVLLFVVMASALMHTNPPAGTSVVVRYVSFIGAFVVLADVLRGTVAPRRCAEVYVISCALAAVCGLFESLVQGDYRAAGPLGDANDFAFFLVAAVPIALALRTYGRRRLWLACAAVSLAAIAGSLSRGAALGLVVVVLWAVAVGHIRPRTAAWSAAFVVASLVVVAVLVPALVSEKLDAKNKVAATNVDERKIRWLVTTEMAADHPVLGIGPGGFETRYEEYVGDRDFNPTHQLKVAHQMYLEVAAELGFVGLTAFLLIGITGWTSARRVVRARGPDRALAVGVQGALLGMAVAAMFLTEQYYLPVWLFPAMGIGLELRRATA
ncbi:MAG TPA: O-antigen ligase family protein [Frankiaceae bacterium]|nr:O-antigen ligase family protein [Frankiaceae bacterium]